MTIQSNQFSGRLNLNASLKQANVLTKHASVMLHELLAFQRDGYSGAGKRTGYMEHEMD